MLYPVYIRHNRDATCHVTFPDFMSCFQHVKGREYLSRHFRQAIERYLREKHLLEIPPSKPMDWFSDKRFKGGYWTMLDLDPDAEDRAWLKEKNEIVQMKIDF